MGIINRTLDVSEQKELVKTLVDDTITGRVYPLYTAPRAQTITDARSTTIGLSGSPTAALYLHRFVVGTGAATYAIGGALTMAAFGTSGNQQFSLPAAGSSLLNLVAGDMVVAVMGGSNAAVQNQSIELVVQNVQDIQTWF